MAINKHRSWFVSSRLAALLAPLTLAGCMTSGQGKLLRADVDALTERMSAMERRDKEINEQVARLKSVLDEATALLGRNSADLGTKVDRNGNDIAALTGRLEEAQHLAGDLQKQIAEHQVRLAAMEQAQQEQQKAAERSAIPTDKETLWKEANARFAGGQRDDARRFFRSFLQRFADDPRAAQAQLQVGISFAQELKHASALIEFSAVVNRFPKAPEAAEAMWQLGMSDIALKFCTDAKAILQDLAKRYPKSPRAEQAKDRLRDLTKMSKDKLLCTS